MRLFFLVVLSLSLLPFVARSESAPFPSDAEMRAELARNADATFSCGYSNKDFIDLSVGLYFIQAVQPSGDGFDLDELTPAESELFKAYIGGLPSFEITQSGPVILTFEAKNGSNPEQLLRDFYLLKTFTDSRYQGRIVLRSSGDCPSGTSVHNF